MASSDMGLMNAVIAASRAASDVSRWDDMLAALCLRFDATAACIHTPRSKAPDRSLFVDHGLPTHTVPDYVEYWSSRDPWMAGAVQKNICVRTGECGIGRELCDWDDLHRLDYFHEFAAPTGVKGLLGMIVDDGSTPSAAPLTVIGLYRRPGLEEFSHQDKRVFESVHAPLQLALQAHWALGRARESGRASQALLDVIPKPLMVLSHSGEVLHANAAGAALLSQNVWAGVRHGKLVRLGQLDAYAVAASLQHVRLGLLQTHVLWKHGADELGASATARLVPLEENNACRVAWPQAVALLLIDEPQEDPQARRMERIAAQYRLTQAERRLADALVDGLTLAEFAERHGISVHTVRTHLRNIFDKTGLSRQADLIRLAGVPRH
ncbi:helix-turn-helix transcriptional regulator [Variovorax boronicumulans]|uniref:helix-turn-helix transcriptional regulator n=1 Tax=Variovorax boronicumulans TaxID=436515 RepID=UPI001C5A03DC